MAMSSHDDTCRSTAEYIAWGWGGVGVARRQCRHAQRSCARPSELKLNLRRGLLVGRRLHRRLGLAQHEPARQVVRARPQLVQRDGWRRLAIVVARVIVGPLALLLPSLAPAVVRALLHRRRRLADEGQQHVADVVVGDLRRLLAPLLGRSAVGLIRRGARLVVQVDRLGLHAVADHSVLDDGTLQHRCEARRVVLRLGCGLGLRRRRGAGVDEERAALAQAHAAADGQDGRRVWRQPLPVAPAKGVDVRTHGRLEVDHVHTAAAVGGGRAVHESGVLARDRVVRHHQVRLLPVAPHDVRRLAREVELLHRLLSAHQPHVDRPGGHDRPRRRLPPVRAWCGWRAQALDDVLHRELAQRDRVPFGEQPRLHWLDRLAGHSHALGGLQVEEVQGAAAVDQRGVLPRDRVVLHEDVRHAGLPTEDEELATLELVRLKQLGSAAHFQLHVWPAGHRRPRRRRPLARRRRSAHDLLRHGQRLSSPRRDPARTR
mmetsp:Transcript_13418/g.31661  ORF Transcript_13418/g.31661 Transcript_13418/m.31661 type:complete len:488 (+) Transcript_13418:101-1564(+)